MGRLPDPTLPLEFLPSRPDVRSVGLPSHPPRNLPHPSTSNPRVRVRDPGVSGSRIRVLHHTIQLRTPPRLSPLTEMWSSFPEKESGTDCEEIVITVKTRRSLLPLFTSKNQGCVYGMLLCGRIQTPSLVQSNH